MEKNYIFSQATNSNATKWNEVTLNICKDEIIININKKNQKCYHITRIKSLFLKKVINDDYDYDDEVDTKVIKLVITFTMNEPIILKSEKNNSKIFQFRRIINAKKLEYYMNICNNFYFIETAKSFFLSCFCSLQNDASFFNQFFSVSLMILSALAIIEKSLYNALK